MKKELLLYRYVDGINDTPFPSAEEQISLTTFTYNAQRMAATPTITASFNFPRCLDDDWGVNVYAEYNGEKYYIRQIPSSSKDNKSVMYKHDITLYSERFVLENIYLYDVLKNDDTNVIIRCDLADFVKVINRSFEKSKLSYIVSIDDSVANTEKALEVKDIALDKVYLSVALQEIYNQWEISYYFEGYRIIIKDHSKWISDTVLEYGYDKSLLSIKKENANFRKITRCSGYGSDKNIPFFYPNLSQKGIIDLEPLESNKLLQKSDFVITDMRKFDKQMPLNGNVVYLTQDDSTPVINGDVDNFVHDNVKIGDKFNKSFSVKINKSNSFIDVKSYFTINDSFWIGVDAPSAKEIDITWKYSYQDALPKILMPILKVIMTVKSSGGTERVYDDIPIEEILGEIKYDVEKGRYSYNITRGYSINASFFASESDLFTSKEKIYNVNLTFYLENSDSVKNQTLVASQYTIKEIFGFTKSDGLIAKTRSYSGRIYSVQGIKTSYSTKTDTGWYLNNTRKINLSDIGVKYLKAENSTISGEGFKQVVVSKIPTATNLMPPLYRESLGNEKFYNAKDNTYLNDNNEYYDFETEWTEVNQNEHIQPFEEIYPTITNIVNADNVAFDEVLDVAFDDNDNNEVDEEGNFLHPYFYVKIAQFNGSNGFNLFDHKIVGGNMQVSFTSGDCSACVFDIMVKTRPNANNETYEDVINPIKTKNGALVSGDWQQKTAGNFGSEDTTQQNSQTNSIWLVLRKDDQTFGTTLPDSIGSVIPRKGDKFVLLNIEMPQQYIDSAEELLRKNIIQYMWENNSDKWNFSIDFSRIFLQENPIFVEDLSENAKVRVKYNGIIYDFYVNNFTYEVKANETLPKIRIGLTDTLSINRSITQAIASGVMKDVQSQLNGVAYLGDLSKQYLRKRYDETMPNNMTFEKDVNIKGNTRIDGDIISNSITSDNYNGSNAFNVGFKLENNENNESVLVVDRAIIRKKIEAFELVINQLKAQGGTLLITAASMECILVETHDTYYRCFLDTQTNNMYNQFGIDDLAICQSFGSSPKRYWRKVVGLGQDYIDLSIEDCEPNSDIPEVGDTIIQLGNTTNIKRQSAIELSSNGEKSPSFTMYGSINSFSLFGKEITGIDFEPDKYEEDENGDIVKVSEGYPNFFSYGSMYFGSRDKKSDYISYQKNEQGNFEMIINAKTTFKSGTQNISDILASIDGTANNANTMAQTANSNANQAQNTANQTKEDLSNLSIGGENLLLGAYKYPSEDEAFSFTSDINDDSFPRPALTCKLEKGQVYTFTAYTDGKWRGLEEVTQTTQVDSYLINVNDASYIHMTGADGTAGVVLSKRILNDGRLCSTFRSETTGEFIIRFDIDYSGNTRKFWQVQIEKGSVPSDWKPAETDTVKPLYDAIKGSTEIVGGLVNTNVLMVKDSNNAISGGLSGVSSDNIAFWSGGTLADAIGGNCNVIIRKDGTAKIGSFIIEKDIAKIQLENGDFATMSASGIEIQLTNGGKATYGIEGVTILDKDNEEKIKLVDSNVSIDNFIDNVYQQEAQSIDPVRITNIPQYSGVIYPLTSKSEELGWRVNNAKNNRKFNLTINDFTFARTYNDAPSASTPDEYYNVRIVLVDYNDNIIIDYKKIAIKIDFLNASSATYYVHTGSIVTDDNKNNIPWTNGSTGSYNQSVNLGSFSLNYDGVAGVGTWRLKVFVNSLTSAPRSGSISLTNTSASYSATVENYSPKTLIGTNGIFNFQSAYKYFGAYLDEKDNYHIIGRGNVDIQNVVSTTNEGE